VPHSAPRARGSTGPSQLPCITAPFWCRESSRAWLLSTQPAECESPFTNSHTTFHEPGSGGTRTDYQIAPPAQKVPNSGLPGPIWQRRTTSIWSSVLAFADNPGRRLPLSSNCRGTWALQRMSSTSSNTPPAAMPTELCPPSISLGPPLLDHPCRALEGGRTCESILTRTGPARTRDMGPQWTKETEPRYTNEGHARPQVGMGHGSDVWLEGALCEARRNLAPPRTPLMLSTRIC